MAHILLFLCKRSEQHPSLRLLSSIHTAQAWKECLADPNCSVPTTMISWQSGQIEEAGTRVASRESDGGQNCRSQGRPRRSGSRQAQTLERGASRSSVNVRHDNQLKDGDIRELNLISSLSRIASGGLKFHCWRTIYRNERPSSEDHRKTNSWVRSTSGSSKTSEMRASRCGLSKNSRMI